MLSAVRRRLRKPSSSDRPIMSTTTSVTTTVHGIPKPAPTPFKPHHKPTHGLASQASSKSPFLSLPPELRHAIYTLLLLTSPNPSTATDILLNPANFLPPSPCRLNLSSQLLRVCRQIHAEAGAVLYGENRFWAHLEEDIEAFGKVVGKVNKRTMGLVSKDAGIQDGGGGGGKGKRAKTYEELVEERGVKGRFGDWEPGRDGW